MNVREKVENWWKADGKVYYTKAKIWIKKSYSSLIFENYHDRTYRNQNVAAAVICFTKKRFWLVVASLIPTFFFPPEAVEKPMVTLYISINAAGIFYLVFNLFPEVKLAFRAAKQALHPLSAIRARRAWLIRELIDADYFSEANRYLTKKKHLELVDILRTKNGYKLTPIPSTGDGKLFSIEYATGHALNIDVKNAYTFSTKTLNDLLSACNLIAEQNLNDIRRLKAIPDIQTLNLYDSLNYLEEAMEEFIETHQGMISEEYLVAYLIQAVDKVNYRAQSEMPLYVGGRYDLKFEPTVEEIELARKQVTMFYNHT